ncbi:helix-turn-helix transcriptional regulator [Sphingomonas sp. AP4-R1]|uniref:helix-turn-helix domain-containing protein n=1 Tax=Sphingomonas sp. AP4-R1 TaxID=2735134 RepID=UPI001493818B|nr:helix-turn-helix transcriptional regulator [Sphingomonas sp. AP4-R1]QJU60276.1 helix-turn-helix transcriptional regulator [Sphingomonas sp. AP4-R1]
MRHPSLEVGAGAEILSKALRAIRRKRGMTAAQVADAMGMAVRTYEDFEGGRGSLTHDRIFAFADATDSDPFALILSPIFKSPAIGIDCADTKFLTIMMMHFEEFMEEQGGDVAYLEPPLIIGGFERVFKDLAATLSNRVTFLQNWLEQRTGVIGLATLRMRGIKRRRRRD